MDTSVHERFARFLAAVDRMELGDGLDQAACHFSAVNIHDWPRIQAVLGNLDGAERPKDGSSEVDSQSPRIGGD